MDPERETLLADAMGLALLVVLDTLNPAERLAFVLHDLFDVPFDEIAPIVGRSPTAARKLASRARRRVQGKGSDMETTAEADSARQRSVVAAFLTASRSGNFAGLLALLDPEVVCRADSAVVASGAPGEVRGATAVAQHFSGRAQDARLTLINGVAGAVWSPGGEPRVVFSFTVADGKVAAIEMIADPARLRAFELTPLENA
jgi:RNA polymerase sigma-70 factor (ECF subfamily)